MELLEFDKVDNIDVNSVSVNIKEALSDYSTKFKSKISSDRLLSEPIILEKGAEFIEKIVRDNNGILNKEYSIGDRIFMIQQKIAPQKLKIVSYDDNGVDYMTEILSMTRKGTTKYIYKLKANAEIHKGNFMAKTDSLGRPVVNEISHIKLNLERQVLNQKLRDGSYRVKDQIGHLIADNFGGPSSKENVVPQLDKVNLSKMKTVENFVKKQVELGKKVDLRVESKYVGISRRPAAFKITIFVDGKELKPIRFFNNKSKFNFKPEYKSTKVVRAEQKVINKVNDIHNSANKVIETLSNKTPSALKPVGAKGLEYAAFSAAISTTANIPKFFNGEISAAEMASEIASDSGLSGVIGAGTSLATEVMLKHGNKLIRSCAHTAPVVVVSYGMEVHDDIVNFTRGKIDRSELFYRFGEGAVSVGGGYATMAATTAASAKIGAMIGTAVNPGVGTLVGGAIGVGTSIVGYTVGSIVATEMYKVAVEKGAVGAERLLNHANNMADDAIELAKETVPDKALELKNAFVEYGSKMGVPFNL